MLSERRHDRIPQNIDDDERSRRRRALSKQRAAAIAAVGARYAVAVTPAMAELIDVADADDPIARQFVPDVRELDRHPAEDADPIGDDLKSPVPGIVHRYPDRVLLKLVSVCPVYCRFCFRREMVGPGKSAALSEADLAAALDYIRAHPEIWEVILTGGDPLILSPRRVAEVTAALGDIEHVKIMRWHSRVPSVAPERVTPALVEALRVNLEDGLRRAACQSSARADRRGARRLPPDRRRRHRHGQPERAVEGRQRRRRHARGADARLRRDARQALLPAPRRPGAGHGAPAHDDRRGPGADARIAGPAFRPRAADLRARHSRRARQGARRSRVLQRTSPGVYRVEDRGGAVHVYEDVCAPPAHMPSVD